MAKAKTKPKISDEARRMLTGDECSTLCEALFRVITNPDAEHPSELIEFVDKAIGYIEAIDDAEGCTTDGLDELIEARAEYEGPGIVRFTE